MAMRLAEGSVPAAGMAKALPSYVFNNNRDGSFEDVSERLSLSLSDTAVAGVVYDDFDDDRDLDLSDLTGESNADAVGQRSRLATEALDASRTGLDLSAAVAATTGDPNKDGRRDVLLFTGQQMRLYVNQGSHRFKVDSAFDDQFARLAATSGQFADMDNDGDLDIVLADAIRTDTSRGPVCF